MTPCPACRESASGVCTRHNGNGPDPLAALDVERLAQALDMIMARVRLALVAGDTSRMYSPAEVALLVRRSVDDTFAALTATPEFGS